MKAFVFLTWKVAVRLWGPMGPIQYDNKNTLVSRWVPLDPLRDKLPLGVVSEVVCSEHLALHEGLQVLNLEVAHL